MFFESSIHAEALQGVCVAVGGRNVRVRLQPHQSRESAPHQEETGPEGPGRDPWPRLRPGRQPWVTVLATGVDDSLSSLHHNLVQNHIGIQPIHSAPKRPAESHRLPAAPRQSQGCRRSKTLNRRQRARRLSAIEGFATASTPDFAVGSGKPVALSGSLQCTVNGLDSDVILHQIVVKTGETVIDAGGEDRGSPKVADLDVTVARGRAQDLLRPFLQDEAPITGLVWLKAHAHVAAADRDAEFLQRLSVDGGFDVPDERLTNRATERTLSAFSQRAQEAKPSNDDDTSGSSADVLSSVEGKVTIRDGMVSTKRLTFQIPGADANLNGTYNLRNGTVHLVGNLRMKSDISHTATGFKSFLLKPLIPFFKKKKAGAVVPIVLKGGPERYQVTQNVLH